MNANNFLMAWRHLLKNKMFSIINIGGLALGISACFVIMQYIFFEMSYDSFHENAKNIYRVKYEKFERGNLVERNAMTFSGLAPALKRDFPEVVKTVKFYPMEAVVSTGTENGERVVFEETNILFADSGFFDVFQFPIVHGSVVSFGNAHTVILSQETAKKYFGKADPIGKTIDFQNHNQGLMMTAIVAAVCQDPPQNSHFRFAFLLPMPLGQNGWDYPSVFTYLLLQPERNAGDLERKFPELIRKSVQTQSDIEHKLTLQSLRSIHLQSDLSNELRVNGSEQLVAFLGLIAFFILIIGYVNFINLSTAKSFERAKEIGVRKVLGSQRLHLLRQFFTESLLVNILAILLATVIIASLLPAFTEFTGVQIGLGFVGSIWFWILLICFVAVSAFASGFYPAIVLSDFDPIKVLKGQVNKLGQGTGLRKGLVVFQFAISIFLMTGTYVIFEQFAFIRKKDLGIAIDQTLIVKTPQIRRETEEDEEMFYQKINSFKTQVLNIAGVTNFTPLSNIPGHDSDWRRPFKRQGADDQSSTQYQVMTIGPDFFDQFKVGLVAGEKFNEEKMNALYASTRNSSIMINEAAVRSFGFENAEDALGEILIDKNGAGKTFPFQIIGVTKNFHQKSLKENFEPIVFRYENGSAVEYFALKLQTNDYAGAIEKVKTQYNQVFAGSPLDYFFLDSFFDEQYKNDRQFGRVFGVFTAIAIFVACSGLFGLSLFMAMQRTREIGIRKLMGASKAGMLWLLVGDFGRSLLIASVTGCLASWFWVVNWLNSYVFKITLLPHHFILPALVVIILTLMTIIVHMFRVASTNPTIVLRHE